MSFSSKDMDANTAGICYGIAAYTAWGVLPLYWKLLKDVPPVEILAHRIFWSFIFLSLVVLFTGGWKPLTAVLADRKKLIFMFICGFIISINWFTYIYAVNTGHVIEASMGYFITPLVVVLMGIGILKEKLSRPQLVAIILASIGVMIITVQYGRMPWIALLLAFSFSLYGLIKKMARVDSVTGMLLETFIVMPIALAYIVSMENSAGGAMGTLPLFLKLILAGAGAVTATPLILFARGIEKTTFSMMGFLQYIAPTITLLLGIFVFREHFTLSHFISFSFIWVALIIFTLANVGLFKQTVPAKAGR